MAIDLDGFDLDREAHDLAEDLEGEEMGFREDDVDIVFPGRKPGHYNSVVIDRANEVVAVNLDNEFDNVWYYVGEWSGDAGLVQSVRVLQSDHSEIGRPMNYLVRGESSYLLEEGTWRESATDFPNIAFRFSEPWRNMLDAREFEEKSISVTEGIETGRNVTSMDGVSYEHVPEVYTWKD